MSKWNETINKFLNNKKLLQDIKTILISLVSLGLPLTYFIFFKDFKFLTLINWTVGWLLIFVIAGNIASWLEFGSKAKRDEIAYNSSLRQEITTTNNMRNKLPKVDYVIEFNSIYNKDKQDNRNTILTNERIKLLESMTDTAKINHKPYVHYEDEILRLKDTPLIDTKYNPVEVKRIISKSEDAKAPIDGNDSMYYNVVFDGIWRFLFFQPFKGIGLGGIGTALVLGLTNDAWTIFAFYILYIIFLSLMIVVRYLSARDKTANRFYTTQINVQDYILELQVWLKKEYDIDLGIDIPVRENIIEEVKE